MKIRNRYANWLIAFFGVCCLRLLFLTVRLDHREARDGATTFVPARGNRRYCFSMWHDAILLALFSGKAYSLAGLISRHQDGTYLSDAAKMLGIVTVRGSASRGGALATRQLFDIPDRHVCVTPDGPRGPRHQMKDGIVYIAARTGRPIVPSALKASRCWNIPGGWSDMILPKPFSRVLAIAGTPIELNENLTREQIADVMERVQDEMDRLDAISDRIIQGDESAANLIGNEYSWQQRQAA